MAITFRSLLASASTLSLILTLCLATGCDTAPPGGGLTNGPPPSAAPSKPGVRSDLPVPEGPDPGLVPAEPQSDSAGDVPDVEPEE